MNHFKYNEDFDVTFGLKPDQKESDADRIIVAAHDHQFVTGTRIAVGSAPWNEEDIRSIKNSGITHVIDCQSTGAGEYLYRGSGIVYLWCGTDDDGELKGADWFMKGVQFAADALKDPNARVLHNCFAGINRGPSMAYATLRAVLGWNGVDAFSAIRDARPIACIAYAKDANDFIANEWCEKMESMVVVVPEDE